MHTKNVFILRIVLKQFSTARTDGTGRKLLRQFPYLFLFLFSKRVYKTKQNKNNTGYQTL